MAGPYGLLATGFALKPETDIRDDLDAGCRTAFGASVPLGPKTVLGAYNGIVSGAIAEVWELAQAVDASQDPDGATGEALEQLCALTGTRRDPASPSLVTLTMTGTPGTPIPTGSRAQSATTTAQFETTEDAALVILAAWADTSPYVVGDRVYYDDSGTMRAYQCITLGTSATGAGNGPTAETDDVTDGTVHWRWLGLGSGADDAEAECTENGPTEATSGDLTVIATPIGGWTSVINLLDADLGSNEESDAHLRLKRDEELSADNASTPDAIREAILKPLTEGGAGATACTVFFNNTDVTDGDGVPPHSVECLVTGGEDQDIFDKVFEVVAAGIGYYGTEIGTALDSEGTSHTVKFTRPDEIEIWVTVTLTYDAALYPADGDDQVIAAIVAFGDAQKTGKDAVATQIGAQAFQVAGVIDVPRSGSLGGTLIGLAMTPTTDVTIAISLRELAVFDSSRVIVVSTPGTP